MITKLVRWFLRRHSALVLVVATLVTAALAAADPWQEPVATVGGRTITARLLVDQLLRKEGAQAVVEICREVIEKVDWRTFAEGSLIELPSGKLDRATLLARITPVHGERVSEELITCLVVEAELVRVGVTVDRALVEAELARAERALTKGLEQRGMARMDFATWLKESEGIGIEAFTARRGFRTLVVGLHELVRREAASQLGEEALRQRFEARQESYHKVEACDCAIIHVPFKKSVDQHGELRITDEERERLIGVMASVYRQIKAGDLDFGRGFRAFARSWDADADAEGRIGWLHRDGTRDKPNCRIVAAEVVAAAFAERGPFPVLLPPVVSAEGVDIVQVLGWRPDTPPDFIAARQELLAEAVEADLEVRTRAMRKRLMGTMDLTRRSDGSMEVGGRPLLAEDIEAELLLDRGAKEAAVLLDELLAAIDWTHLPDDRPVAAGRGWQIEKATLERRLLERYGASAREDLIALTLLDVAGSAAGIVVDVAAIDDELARLRRAYGRSPESRRTSFAAFIHETYGASMADLRQDQAFKALATAGALLRRRALPTDEEVRVFYDLDPGRWRRDEAVDCSIITLLHRAKDGKVVTDVDRQRTRLAAGQLQAILKQQPDGFVDAWRRLGQVADPKAVDGRVGWIDRRGRRADEGVMPPEVVDAAFAAVGPYPVLLPPIESESGLAVVLVHQIREGKRAAFTEVIEEVRGALLESEWDRRLQGMVDDLRRETPIVYGDLTAIAAGLSG